MVSYAPKSKAVAIDAASPYGHHRGHRQSQLTNLARVAIQDATQAVYCQRFFTTKFGSHYIQVRRPSPSYEPIEPPLHPTVVQGLVNQLEECFTASQASDKTIVQAGELDKANPWLRRTQWAQYLQGIPVRPLSEAIATPNPDTEGPEGIDAMDQIARVSQRITKQCGHLIRIEAARTEKDQSPHQLLQAYMDIDNIIRHVELWQRVLMFFARTQQPHEWRSPRYRFISRQQRAWQAL
ncbi:hypothetical protein N7523_006530 [Penicillium sp. IBT 18751x]|nr:hypothetical protein N7523_006530 [Penicillium sp. IBT 18751x]